MNRQLERSVANDFLKSLGTRVQRISLLKGGLIHKTFLVEAMNDMYFVLQGVNTQVFSNPNLVVMNQQRIAKYLEQKGYPKICLTMLANIDERFLLLDHKGQTWRMFNAIFPSKSLEVLGKHSQAFAAAKALSEFHSYLMDFPKDQLQESIPGFRRVTAPILRTAGEGADTIAWLAVVNPLPKASGTFWSDREVRPTHKTPQSKKLDTESNRLALWKYVENLSK